MEHIDFLNKLKAEFGDNIYKKGLYKITIITEGNYYYIGMASGNGKFNCQKGFYRRWKQHLSSLVKGNHRNRFFNRIFNKYGFDVFKFEIVEFIEDKNKCIEKENLLITTLNPPLNFIKSKQTIPECGLSPESLRKMSLCKIGTKHSEETKQQISKSAKGNKRSLKGITINSEVLDNIIYEILENKECIKNSSNLLKIHSATLLRNLKLYMTNSDFINLKKISSENGKQKSLSSCVESNTGRTKYNDEIVLNIISLYRSGLLIKNISKIIKLNEDLIGTLIKNNMDPLELKIIRSKNAKRK